jgi:hypothetical protein
MYSQKTLLLFLALTVLTACQTKSVSYEVDTVVRPMQPFDERGKPQQYMIDITVTETGANGENILMKPHLVTMLGKQAEVSGEEILCIASVTDENGGTRVDTSVGITKEGKEVYLFKQSTTLPL